MAAGEGPDLFKHWAFDGRDNFDEQAGFCSTYRLAGLTMSKRMDEDFSFVFGNIILKQWVVGGDQHCIVKSPYFGRIVFVSVDCYRVAFATELG